MDRQKRQNERKLEKEIAWMRRMSAKKGGELPGPEELEAILYARFGLDRFDRFTEKSVINGKKLRNKKDR